MHNFKKILCVQYLLVSVLFVSMLLSACEPKNYDDCILKNMKDIKNESAAKIVSDACFNKHYKLSDIEKCKTRELTSAELSKVQIKGRPSPYSNNVFQLNIYNGNEKLMLNEITISLNGDNFSNPQIYKESIFVDSLDDLPPGTPVDSLVVVRAV